MMKSFNQPIQLIKSRRKLYRFITHQILNKIYFLIYVVFYPLNLFVSIYLYFKILFIKNPQRIIIRNDRLGDSILTLPFLLGSKSNQDYYFISEILENIIKEINIIDHWKSVKLLKGDKNNLIVANLSCKKRETFNKDIKNKYLTLEIISQLSFKLFSNAGRPVLFTPNFASNISQTKFIRNSFNKIGIKSDPILGIRLLNNQLKKINIKRNSENLFIIVLGLGLDQGRKINNNVLKEIIDVAHNYSLKPIILEEPGFIKLSKSIAKKNNISSKRCENILDLFLLFRNSQYVIGYDSGPMHIASLVSNSIILFSHVSPNQWGTHIWNKHLFENILKSKHGKLKYSKQLNKGNNKMNWIIYGGRDNCPLHRKICKDQICSELNEELLIQALRKILL